MDLFFCKGDRMKDSFKFFTDYWKIMPGKNQNTKRICSMFLQDVMGLMAVTKSEIIDGRRFFECPVSFLENSIMAWKSDEQYRFLKWLQEYGFVHLVQHGPTRCRWIHFDYEAIENALSEADNKERSE